MNTVFKTPEKTDKHQTSWLNTFTFEIAYFLGAINFAIIATYFIQPYSLYWGNFAFAAVLVIFYILRYLLRKPIRKFNRKSTKKPAQGLGKIRPILFSFYMILVFFCSISLILLQYEVITKTFNTWFGISFLQLSYEVFVTICIAMLALFTLGIAAWRAALHSLQEQNQSKSVEIAEAHYKLANDQFELNKKQFELTEQQFNLAIDNFKETKQNNIAKLLIDGIGFLGEDTSEAEKMGGFACLTNIIEGQNSFSKHAMDVVKSAIIIYGRANVEGINILENKNPWFFYAMDALQKYSTIFNEKISVFGVVLTGLACGEKFNRWPNLHEIIYKEFKFERVDFTNFPEFYIDNCEFVDCKIDKANRLFTVDCKTTHETGVITKGVKPSKFTGCTFIGGNDFGYSYQSPDTTLFKHAFTGSSNCYEDEFDNINAINFFDQNNITPCSKKRA